MADFKGGRGKKVGYKTQMYRIPTPLRPTVERLGMQFRLLWDGLVDPTGEKLISRIEGVIPDPSLLSDSNTRNQISGKGKVAISDIKYQELEDKLARCQSNCAELRQENQRLLADAAKADAAISELRSLLEQAQPQPAASESAAALLQDALKLKANAGGAIKDKIREALALLANADSQ